MRINLGISSLLTLLFIYLKLSSVITWSWAWVLSPIWAPILVAILLIILALIAITYADGR